MPGKARRVAARQSQLNRRRRKQGRGPSGTPPLVAAQVQVDDRPSDDVAVQPIQTAAPAPASIRATPAAAQHGPSSLPRSARVRGERPDAYSYVRSEIRRILAMASVVVVTLVVLGVWL
jgi:hypothetical protein